MVERSSRNSKNSNTTTTVLAEFTRVIEPLELQVGRRLGNPKRRRCLEAFVEFPEGVRQVVEGVLADARRNPIGLFVYRIEHCWHELEPLPEPEASSPLEISDGMFGGSQQPWPLPVAFIDTCMQCGQEAACHDHRRLSKILCSECYRRADQGEDFAATTIDEATL